MKKAVLLHNPLILSKGLWRLDGTHLLSEFVWSDRETSLEILHHGWVIEPGPRRGLTVRCIIFPTELSWLYKSTKVYRATKHKVTRYKKYQITKDHVITWSRDQQISFSGFMIFIPGLYPYRADRGRRRRLQLRQRAIDAQGRQNI